MNYILTPNELREMLGLRPIDDSHYLNSNTKIESNNCPNCGAPITSWKCEYCDTVFDKERIDKQKELIKELALEFGAADNLGEEKKGFFGKKKK